MPDPDHETLLNKAKIFLGYFLFTFANGFIFSICVGTKTIGVSAANAFLPPIVASLFSSIILYKGRHQLFNDPDPLLNSPWMGRAIIVWVVLFCAAKIFIR